VTLAGADLQYALDRNHVTAVHAMATFVCADIFSEWVNWTWEQRGKAKAAGKRLEASIWKRMMVGLYGKWAGSLQVWKEWPTYRHDHVWGTWIEDAPDASGPTMVRAIGGRIEYLSGRKLAADVFPAISAFTTAHARRYMDGLRSLIATDRIVYQCIDELHVIDSPEKYQTFLSLVQPEVLGKLKHVRTCMQNYYAGPNVYLQDGQLTCAGVPESLTSEGEGSWSYTIWQSLKEILKHEPPKHVESQRRFLRLDKGLIGRNGSVAAPTPGCKRRRV